MSLKRAAVAVIIRNDNEALFVRRIKREGDPWSGDIAFPGGMCKTEEDFIHAVIREVYEEVGIDLKVHEFLAELPFVSSSRFPDMKVKPFIFKLRNEVGVKKNDEIDEFFWISLPKLKRKFVFIEKIARKRIAYVYGDVVIWGLTYRILKVFKKEFPQFFLPTENPA